LGCPAATSTTWCCLAGKTATARRCDPLCFDGRAPRPACAWWTWFPCGNTSWRMWSPPICLRRGSDWPPGRRRPLPQQRFNSTLGPSGLRQAASKFSARCQFLGNLPGNAPHGADMLAAGHASGCPGRGALGWGGSGVLHGRRRVQVQLGRLACSGVVTGILVITGIVSNCRFVWREFVGRV
jgi:hypothetical protein